MTKKKVIKFYVMINYTDLHSFLQVTTVAIDNTYKQNITNS